MRHTPFFATALLIFLLSACTNSTKTPPKPFTASMLARQVFLINPETDTSLETLHGSVIRIAAGSFSINGPVEIQIREAFTPAEILAAGLTTESNGRPLRSSGMIYINATSDGDSIGLIKPIKVSVPNQVYDSAMQVFKGIKSDSGTVNWVEPEPVDTTAQSQLWKKGKKLFESRCTSCHTIFSDLTGPSLGDVVNRWGERSQIYQWVRDWSLAVRSGYPRALEVVNYSPSEMQKFTRLSDSDIDAMLTYLQNEYNNPAGRAAEKAYRDSIAASRRCKADTIYVPAETTEKSFFSDTLVVTDELLDSLQDMEESVEESPIKVYTPGMYDFEITKTGWYNIDAYVEGNKGVISASITAELKMETEEVYMNVYLFCPSNKTFSWAYRYEDNIYSFNKIDNKGIPLFRGERAIIFAIGSQGDKIYYGIREFYIQPAQTLEVPVKESTEKEIRDALLSQKMEGIDLGLEKKEMKITMTPCDSVAAKPGTTKKK